MGRRTEEATNDATTTRPRGLRGFGEVDRVQLGTLSNAEKRPPTPDSPPTAASWSEGETISTALDPRADPGGAPQQSLDSRSFRARRATETHFDSIDRPLI